MKNTTDIQSRPQSPLLAKFPLRIQDWAQWREHWEVAQDFETLHSLLNCGFSIEATYDEACERVIFYLQIAGEHMNPELDPFVQDPRWPLSHRQKIGELRQLLTRKAFVELSENFFTNKNGHVLRPSWYNIAVDPQVVSELVNFFRTNVFGKVRAIHLRQQDDKQAVQRAGEFLLKFCRLGWNSWGNGSFYDCAFDGIPALPELQPRFVELLLSLGKAQWLMSDQDYPFTPACWIKLEQLAFAPRHLPHLKAAGRTIERKPVTVEEAVADGSVAAHVLLIRRLKEAEAARQ